jgi:TetR/AcrR family transcriptional repressor of nem operon
MTDLEVRSRDGKRERLVAATRELVHRQGVEKTTLADIAQVAEVPVGNIYYYFKTKDELVEAAIESLAREVGAMLESLEAHRTPQARLMGLLVALSENADLTARYGCPMGSLCSELDKRQDSVEAAGARLLRLPLQWTEAQFRAMGRRDAEELALALIASYQGIALLTNTFRDPEIMSRELRRLKRWIDSLA